MKRSLDNCVVTPESQKRHSFSG